VHSRRWLVLLYSLGGIVAIVLLAVASFIVLRQTSTDEAVRDARQQNRVLAVSVVEPALTDEAEQGDRGFVERFDGIVRRRILPTGVARVKIWNADGRIVYSDESRLDGERFPLGGDEQEVLRDGGSDAGVSDLTAPENRYEAPDRKLLEVYTQVRTPDGTPLLFETYYPYAAVTASRNQLLDKYAPIVLTTLAILAVVQLTLAFLLSRRIRREQEERERLYAEAARASEDERRRIARDLHDGVVQDLAGVSYAIAGALDGLGPDVDGEGRAALEDASVATRRGISQLRTLLVDIYPPNLATEGLEAALTDLLTRAQRDGLATELHYAPETRLTDDEQALAFRVAQEAIRNTLRHAGATRVAVRVGPGRGGTVVVVSDDGRGFDPDSAAADGHFGLQYLRDAAERAGAGLDVISKPGQGTLVRLRVGAA
jgi:two-component system, NarL family, sensor kinase